MHQNAKLLFIALISLVLAACSSGKLVKTYEGSAMTNDQVAVLKAPENISLISVNGRKVPKYMLSSINVNYALKPGTNYVVFEYESVWAIASKGEDGKRSELVTSGPQEVVIEATAGDQLTFEFDQVENVRDARALAGQFKANIIDAAGTTVAMSDKKGVYQPPVQNVAISTTPQAIYAPVQPVVAPGATTPASSAPVQSSLPPLEGLKVLWKSASTDEKKAFLEWAFQ